MYYIYFLQCDNRDIYIGCTSDIKDRLLRHKKGLVPTTRSQKPLKLLGFIGVKDKYHAYQLEKYFKSGSGRAFIKKHFLV